MFSPSHCDLTALPFTPSNQNPLRIFHAQRERYSHSVVSLRHRSGNAIYPLKRGLFPRHLHAEKARFFVHARIPDGSSRHAGRKGKKSFKKIVQICALLCIEINALGEGVLAHLFIALPLTGQRPDGRACQHHILAMMNCPVKFISTHWMLNWQC